MRGLGLTIYAQSAYIVSGYIHQRPDWPRFQWNQETLAAPLAEIRHRQGRLLGRMEGLGFALQKEAELETLTLDVLKSSEIEGENLNPEQVRSSIARRLGMDAGGAVPADRHVEGVVEMMLDATQNFAASLSAERLFGWHAALFPTGRSGMRKIIVGAWRDEASGPMQIVSGPVGRERVHYEAPEAPLLDAEMSRFFAWANEDDRTDAVLKAALAHLWFVTIHPFDDGNGRIARAIADWQLARSENSAQRFYSMSAQIRQERNDYYDILERTQKGTLDITPWLEWFFACLGRAFDGTETTLGAVMRKARFWERAARLTVNERQRGVLNRLLDGFTGNLTTVKWARLAKCSHDTALRDIQSLIELGLLKKDAGGGRSTSYSLNDG
ncbi:MAG: cell filamentation protein Fic [Chloroflexi bacterium]|nr:cell filamentation protein Fic [Chloroflexota bacterium]